MATLEQRVAALETSKHPARVITYYTGDDDMLWQNNGGLCTPCAMPQEEWEARTAAQQAKLIAGL